MPTIDTDYDGVVYKYTAASWATVRSASSGFVIASSPWTTGITNQATPGRGGVVSNVGRFFMEFDTSGISVAPSSALLKVCGTSVSTTLDVLCVRGEQSGSTVSTHFNDIYNASTELSNSDGIGGGALSGISGLLYSNTLTSWNNSGYNNFVLTSQALSDIASEDSFKVVMIGLRDYEDAISLGTAESVSLRLAGSGSSTKPFITYVAGVEATDNATFFGCNF